MREKLHGRTAQGTWVQLEKTPAAFGKKKLPSLTDLRHLWDFVVYRVTRSNVGPWGLSRLTERRPMYLSPVVAVPTPLTRRSRTRWPRRCDRSRPPTTSPRCHRTSPAGSRHPSEPTPGANSARHSPAAPGAGCSATRRFGSPKRYRGRPRRSCVSAIGVARRQRQRHRCRRAARRCGMSDTDRNDAATRPDPASVQEGLVSAVVNLVNTGPVLLGAYTIAELTAVDAIVDFLESRPSDEVLAEAVRSLAARQLLVAGSAGEQVQVRGRSRHRGRVPAAGPDGSRRSRHRHRAGRAVAHPAAAPAGTDLPHGPHRCSRRARNRLYKVEDALERAGRLGSEGTDSRSPARCRSGRRARLGRALGADHVDPIHHRRIGRESPARAATWFWHGTTVDCTYSPAIRTTGPTSYRRRTK